MRSFFLPLLLLLASCTCFSPEVKKEEAKLTPVSFADLEDWNNDAPSEALEAFKKSCPALDARWKATCAAARSTPDARGFFETEFIPYAVEGPNGTEGLFTGYYLPELTGSLKKENATQTPLYARPSDLITADLGQFKSELKGQKLSGKVFDGKFIPYDDRASIAKESLASRAEPLVWIDNPIDSFFLEIQGSGRVKLRDGTYLYIGYDSSNGRPYAAIGRLLADKGELERPVTMPSIRAKLATEPDRAQEIMNWNPSYVFFRILTTKDAVGAQGVPLTPTRSLAVDRRFIPLGAPVWLDTTDGKGAPLRRLVIAQDTGGAIKGIVRGDFFWGAGPEATDQAGSMQSQGRYYVLLPKTISPNGK